MCSANKNWDISLWFWKSVFFNWLEESKSRKILFEGFWHNSETFDALFKDAAFELSIEILYGI